MSIGKASVSLSDLVQYVRGIVGYTVHKGTGIKGVLGPHMHRVHFLDLMPVSDYKEWRILGETLSQFGVDNEPYKAGDMHYELKAVSGELYDEIASKFLRGMATYVGFLYDQRKPTYEALEEAIRTVHIKPT